MFLPSHDVIIKEKDKDVSFTLPKEEQKGGIKSSRAMSFGNDFSTRIFRLFVSYMIRYKLFWEHLQHLGAFMDVQIERFLKVE